MRGKGRPSLSGATVGGKHPPYAILGPCPCSVCGTLLYYARGVTRVNGIQTKGLAWWREPTGRMHAHRASRARAKGYNRGGRVRAESNSILPATVVPLLTPGGDRRAASRE